MSRKNAEYQQRKNETELRRDFQYPLLDVLSWDVGNHESNAELYKSSKSPTGTLYDDEIL